MPSLRVAIPIRFVISAPTWRPAYRWFAFSSRAAEHAATGDDEAIPGVLQRIQDAGLLEGRLASAPRRYRVRVRYGECQLELEDAYRFPPILSEFDLYLLGEGTHMHL